MYQLSQCQYIAKGLHRECYVHPENPDLCIKVVVNGNNAETKREQSYYSLLQKRNISWDMLPKFYGNVETDLGQGAVFDLIRDYNGEVALTLRDYLRDEIKTHLYYTALLDALTAFKAYLFKNNIITMTLKPKNMVFQRTSSTSGKIITIDNIGNSDFIPAASYFSCIGKKKIQRKWEQFETLLIKNYPDNECVAKLVFDVTQ